MEKTFNFDNVTTDQLAKALDQIPLLAVSNITKDIAKRSKKKVITSGNKFFSQFIKEVAQELLKPANYEILAKYHNTYNLV